MLDWRGVHLLHARGSSCSQKVRIFLNLKNISWHSHEIDLKANENHTDWYLGINPRGLVPCLVHNGQVHIESNDILAYLEACFPEPALMPEGMRDRIGEHLEIENELHTDLRVLTFRFVIPSRAGAIKNIDALERLQRHAGTINGKPDPGTERELKFWQSANRNGITDEQVARAAQRFHAALGKLDWELAHHEFCLGSELTVVDIAWYVYVTRLQAAGYPVMELHPRVGAWHARLDAMKAFHSEVQQPPAVEQARMAWKATLRSEGRELREVSGL